MEALKNNILKNKVPAHIAIIMDGNGRWAKLKNKPRIFGHKNGVNSVRETIEACGDIGVEYLTLYAFSTENWNRPPSARRGMETMIRLQLVPTGRVVGVTVLKSSGDSAFDRSVEQAAFKADQFIELQKMSPSLFEKKFRQVDVLFSPQDLRL